MASSLVSGNKEYLLGEFRRLKALNNHKWRSLLKNLDKWHDTTEGLYAWQNAAKGKVGNEALRKIVCDMLKIEKITEKEGKKSEKVISRKKLDEMRSEAIERSLRNLNKVKSKTGKTENP